MTKVRLTEQIHPLLLSKTGARIAGELKLKTMGRLGEVLNSSRGQVQLQLDFGKEEAGIAQITGHIQAELELICQRCGEPMIVPMDIHPQLGPVMTALQADQLPPVYEPLITNGETVRLRELVEDELLLALPLVVKHPDE